MQQSLRRKNTLASLLVSRNWTNCAQCSMNLHYSHKGQGFAHSVNDFAKFSNWLTILPLFKEKQPN